MKKVALIIALLAVGQAGFSQTDVAALAAEAECKNQEALLNPLIKSSEHEKRGIKASTWLRLAEGYATYTNACGKDSTSSIKAWDAINKAKELDTDGKSKDAIDAFVSGEALYGALMNQGVGHYNNGNQAMAAKLFALSMEVKPADTTATFYAGVLANQVGDMELAKKAFQQYIEVADGKDPSSFYTLAQIYKSEDNLDKAIQWLETGINKTGDKDLRGELINTYISNNMLDRAVIDLKKLLDINPNNTNILLNLGLIYDNQGEKVKAKEIYEKVLTLEPDNFDANYSLAAMYFNEGVLIKNEVDAMDMKTYRAEGKAIEDKACVQFKSSKPYFEKCAEVRPESEEIETQLSNLNNVISSLCGN